jgi:hypothetical protein
MFFRTSYIERRISFKSPCSMFSATLLFFNSWCIYLFGRVCRSFSTFLFNELLTISLDIIWSQYTSWLCSELLDWSTIWSLLLLKITLALQSLLVHWKLKFPFFNFLYSRNLKLCNTIQRFTLRVKKNSVHHYFAKTGD